MTAVLWRNGENPETVQHVFLNCSKIKYLFRKLFRKHHRELVKFCDVIFYETPLKNATKW